MSPLIIFLVIAAVFACIFMLRSALGFKKRELIDRLEREVRFSDQTLSIDSEEEQENTGGLKGIAISAAGHLGRYYPGREGETAESHREKLIQAGFRQPNALEIFLGARALLIFLGAFLSLSILSRGDFPLPQSFAIGSVLIAIGFFYPKAWLDGRVQDRQKELNRMLPDAMDLIVICVEAGLSMDQAINRVGQEISVSSPLLAKELTQTALEIEAGVGRAEAFRKLATRTGIEDLRILSAMIIQAEQFGSSIAKSVRLQSKTMRLKRMQKLEELAAKVPSRMTIPLILFILPAMFSIILGPAIVQIYHIFSGP